MHRCSWEQIVWQLNQTQFLKISDNNSKDSCWEQNNQDEDINWNNS